MFGNKSNALLTDLLCNFAIVRMGIYFLVPSLTIFFFGTRILNSCFFSLFTRLCKAGTFLKSRVLHKIKRRGTQ